MPTVFPILPIYFLIDYQGAGYPLPGKISTLRQRKADVRLMSYMSIHYS